MKKLFLSIIGLSGLFLILLPDNQAASIGIIGKPDFRSVLYLLRKTINPKQIIGMISVIISVIGFIKCNQTKTDSKNFFAVSLFLRLKIIRSFVSFSEMIKYCFNCTS